MSGKKEGKKKKEDKKKRGERMRKMRETGGEGEKRKERKRERDGFKGKRSVGTEEGRSSY